ncbi:MAG: heavy metal translocating P-type ATPase [Candidatus Sungbacteria bacterium]|uniref:P-type Cu(+) transporter n=1 Tax=Candidatus Sungiibacteriota bacterium TaxID=2750080 RepID=A0A9D6LSF1_9BACT|nr:heavy metal translocating P-type ATPase [Candidatus Sungbacteria bacterium]
MKTVLKVKGMHCASCAILIDKLVAKELGVVSVKTNYGAEKTAIEYDESKVKLERLDELVHKLGYDIIRPDEVSASVEEEEAVEARKIEESRRRVKATALLAGPIIVYYMLIHMFNLPHVHELFDFLNQAQPLYASPGAAASMISQVLSFGAYSAEFLLWFVAQPLKLIASIFMDVAHPPFRIDLNYIYWILATPIQFVIAWPFYRNAITAVRVGSANMDVLVVLGTSAAYFYSMFGFLFFGIDHPFWESSAALLFFIILGRHFEAVARGRASAAIKELLKLEAKEAHVIRAGQEVTVPIDQIQKGEVVVVRPGEKIPVDGVIVEGKTHIDEKVVTGESFPVGKGAGDEVIGATINQEGLFKFKATKVGKETLLYQIIQMVEEAQATRAPIQDLVDKISEYFVPAVVVLAVVTFSAWYFILVPGQFRAALIKAIAVLVISCPCAMGLATPTALIVGIGRAARFGIILKGGEALEKAYKISLIAFDKTGTLTIGKPVVTNFLAINGADAEAALALAAGVETGSEHPLSRAVIEKQKEKGAVPEVKDFKALSGFGVEGTVLGKKVRLGNSAYMQQLNVAIEAHRAEAEKLENEAKTVVFLAVDGKAQAIIAMADTLKPHAKEAILALKKMGKEIVMITGDNPRTAEAIAKEIGIDRAMAQVLPQDKAAVIKKLQAEGKTVAMVGDGINDSPALAQADIGIAVGSGTDVAVQTGQVVLVKDDLRDVVTSIQLSGKTIHKVWQNLFWAFIYNVVAIPVAGGLHLFVTQTRIGGAAAPWVVRLASKMGKAGSAFLNLSQSSLRPEIAGFAMAFSSVSVVTNSLFLRRYLPPMEREKLKEAAELKSKGGPLK